MKYNEYITARIRREFIQSVKDSGSLPKHILIILFGNRIDASLKVLEEADFRASDSIALDLDLKNLSSEIIKEWLEENLGESDAVSPPQVFMKPIQTKHFLDCIDVPEEVWDKLKLTEF